MVRKLMFVLASLLIASSMLAQQQPTHYPFNYHDYPNTMNAIIQIQIDGVEQTSNEFELGAFNGNVVTGAERIGCYGSLGYYRAYLSVSGTNGSSYEVTFKLYNHQTEEEFENYDISYQGEPYTFTWIGDSFIGNNRNPLVINFVTTSTRTYTKEIIGYGNNDGGYYLIATPIDDVNPAEIEDMIATPANNYDLYWFDQTEELEWRNYKQDPFNLVSGMGYLYANKYTVELSFTGMPIEEATYNVSLVMDDRARFSGWNLVGNPFAEHTAYIDRPFYVMNNGGTEIMAQSVSRGIEPLEGAFVIATSDGETLTFSTTAPTKTSEALALNLTDGQGVIDRAIVDFGEGLPLPKFQLSKSSSKVYIPKDGQDYALVHSESLGEMPINFKAAKNGTYSFLVSTENANMNYLHLIDNMTATDVDLLQNQVYTFEAKKTDNENRFKLVFVCEDSNNSNEAFAFIDASGNIVINGIVNPATLQIVDVTGRIIRICTDIMRNVTINGIPAGVYVLQLIDGDNVKVQKIVIG